MATEVPAEAVRTSTGEAPAVAEVKIEVAPPPNEAPPMMPGESVAPSNMGLATPPPEEEKKSTIKKLGVFLYDSKNGRVLGRPGMSWLRIFFFYIFYYFFVFSYFFLCLLFLITFSGDNKPDMTVNAPVILAKATGLSVFPTAPKTGQAEEPKQRVRSSTIYYDVNSTASWQVYSDRLDKIVKSIDDYPAPVGGGECNYENNYGYHLGKPCVLLRFNRVFDWKPKPMKDLKNYLKDNYKETDTTVRNFDDYVKYLQSNWDFHDESSLQMFMDNYVGIQCMRDGGEESNIGPLKYFPVPGIHVGEYENGLKEQEGKMKDKAKRWNWTPYIFVQFIKPLHNTFISVICKAFEEDMNLYNSREGVGAVRFSLFILNNYKKPDEDETD